MTPQEAVKQFHEAFGLPVLGSPEVPPNDRIRLRRELLGEEWGEADEELKLLHRGGGDIHALAKELSDLLYVAYGCAHEFGIDLDLAFSRVHESNMSKLGDDGKPVYRDDGKVLKGPNYRPVNIDTILNTEDYR
jgi:predicted HAD superfamily Cof-like phosphohydrolase